MTMPSPPPPKTELAALPDVLQTIDGTLVVPTSDDALAHVALDGFRYLSALEFARRQPALALLYELDIEHLGTRTGSRLIDFRIFVGLRHHLRTEIDKPGAVAPIAEVLALPDAISASLAQWTPLFSAVQAQLQHDLPQCPPTIGFVVHPAPERPDPHRGRGHAFNL